jgi:hypothetical protein
MVLPLIIAAAAGGLTTYFMTKDKSPPESTTQCSKGKSKLSNVIRNEFEFEVRLILAAASADGISEEEEEFLATKIESFKERYDLDETYCKRLTHLLETPSSIGELSERWEAINPKKQDEYTSIISEVVKADGRITNEEKAFLYRCELMFNNIPDQEIYMLKEPVGCLTSTAVNYLSPENIPKDINVSNMLKDQFYIVHPSHINQSIRELVLISELCGDSFLTSQDTELVNVARISGAKSVLISSKKSKTEESLSAIKAELNLKKMNAKTEKDIANQLQHYEAKELKFEFQGNETTFFKRLLKFFINPEDKILKKSKWLQHDPDLTEFVRSCFSENKATYFSKEISTKIQRSAVMSAKLAVDCKLLKMDASSKAEIDKKISFFAEDTKIYKVQF